MLAKKVCILSINDVKDEKQLVKSEIKNQMIKNLT